MERIMADTEAKLDYLENSIRLSNKAFEILFFLLTAEERGQMLYNSLTQIEGIVKDLNDEHLLTLYQELFKSSRISNPYQLIHPDDYFAFLQRISTLINEAAAKANEADIALREVIGLQSVIGIWGGRGWRPNRDIIYLSNFSE
jgi:hypothetical protein